MDHSIDASTADGWFGAKFKRKEDQRLITGRGRYIADIAAPYLVTYSSLYCFVMPLTYCW